MGLDLKPEKLDGKYDGVTPTVMLKKGQIADGQNMRRVGVGGGWKPRKGSTLVGLNQIESELKKIDFSNDVTWGGADYDTDHVAVGDSSIQYAFTDDEDLYCYRDYGLREDGDGYFNSDFVAIGHLKRNPQVGSVGVLTGYLCFSTSYGTTSDMRSVGDDAIVVYFNSSNLLTLWLERNGSKIEDAVILRMSDGEEYTIVLEKDATEETITLSVFRDRSMSDLHDSVSIDITGFGGDSYRYFCPFASGDTITGNPCEGKLSDVYVAPDKFNCFVPQDCDETDIGADRIAPYADRIVMSNVDDDETIYYTKNMGENFFAGSWTYDFLLADLDAGVAESTNGEYIIFAIADGYADILENQTTYLWVSYEDLRSGSRRIAIGAVDIRGTSDTAAYAETDLYIRVHYDAKASTFGIVRVSAWDGTAASGAPFLQREITLQSSIEACQYMYFISKKDEVGAGNNDADFSHVPQSFRRDVVGYSADEYDRNGTILGLHYFTRRYAKEHEFLIHRTGSLYKSLALPNSNQMLSIGSRFNVNIPEEPSTAAFIGQDLIVAAKGMKPIVWGGRKRSCLGFLAYEDDGGTLTDYLKEVTDGSNDTYATVDGGIAACKYYVCSPEIANQIYLVLNNSNTDNDAAITVKSWVGTAWEDRTAKDMTSGLFDSLKLSSHNQSGRIEWTRNSADTMRVMEGKMGFWYEVSFDNIPNVDPQIISCDVYYEPTELSHRWDGNFQDIIGVKHYDGADYTDYFGRLANSSEELFLDLSQAAITNFIYIKTLEPATGFSFAILPGKENTAAAEVDNVDHWDGTAWSSEAGLIDTTLIGAIQSFNQSGVIWWDATQDSPVKTTFQGDNIPGYWYRVSWDAALSTEVQIFQIMYAPFPRTFPKYIGVAEFAGRAVFWGDPRWSAYLRVGVYNDAGIFNGTDSSYVGPFGGADEIIACVKFLDWFWVFKRKSIYLMDKNLSITTISNQLGIASPRSLQTVDAGFPDIHSDERRQVLLWQDVDGVYAADNSKPMKVSSPIDHFFNESIGHSDLIDAEDLNDLGSFLDPMNNEYHLLLPTKELVFNFVENEWYPPWNRSMPLSNGLAIKIKDSRKYLVGATHDGYIHLLEQDTTDKDSSNTDAAISHFLTSRAVGFDLENLNASFTLRRVFAIMKAQSAGTITPTLFVNMKTAGQALTAESIVNSGYDLISLKIPSKAVNCTSAAIKLASTTADVEMEIYSLAFELELKGKGGS